MTTHANPPETAGPQVPLQSPVPPKPTLAPGVFESPVPAGLPAPVVKLTVWAQTRRGCQRLYQQGRALVLLEGVDEETLTEGVSQKRAKDRDRAIQQHRNDITALRKQFDAATQQGHDHRADRYQNALASLRAAGPAIARGADEEITSHDVKRHKRTQQTGRCAIVAGVAAGTLMLGPQHPLLLLAALVGGFGAAWWAGRNREADDDKESSQVGLSADAPSTIAAAASAGGPGPAVLTKADAVQVRGADDLITAFVKAKVIDDNERDETRIVGLRSDGPGWTATIELPPGRPAAHAIDRLVPLASALRVKASRIEMKADTSAGGHEGQFTMWVADADNPFGGGKNRSMLIDAPRWEFWQDGAPLGADARHARQALHLMWSSLLIGGLQDYGKSYLARLIAAAAALDPYVRIVVITGKAGPDWAPLKKIADAYTAGSTPDRLAQVHEILDELIVNMQGRGETLEQLSEEDPATCPEGKLTPDLARKPGMELTLLIVDELQELLDAAANTRVKGEEDEDGKTGRGRNGKEVLVETLARYVRVTRFVGGMGVFITQRPDSDSVPTKLREVCVKRGSFRVKGPGSSKMVLGEEAVQAGAAPHKLLEHHKGVVVLDQGAETGHVTVKADVIELPEFRAIVDRAYDLRVKAGTLTGQAASRSRVDEAAARAKELRRAAVAVFDRLGVPETQGLTAESLAEELGADVDALRERLRRDGITTTNIVTFGDRKRLKGFKRDQFTSPEAA